MGIPFALNYHQWIFRIINDVSLVRVGGFKPPNGALQTHDTNRPSGW